MTDTEIKNALMQIVKYEDKYIEQVRDLLVQLEEYLVSVDQDHLDMVGPEYREKMILHDLAVVAENHGAAFVALNVKSVVGFVAGIVRPYTEADRLDYKCPKCGIITELVVDESKRGNGIGRSLIQRMEQYFTRLGCETMTVDVFAYNGNAKRFYAQCGYHPRMISMMKVLDK